MNLKRNHSKRISMELNNNELDDRVIDSIYKKLSKGKHLDNDEISKRLNVYIEECEELSVLISEEFNISVGESFRIALDPEEVQPYLRELKIRDLLDE